MNSYDPPPPYQPQPPAYAQAPVPPYASPPVGQPYVPQYLPYSSNTVMPYESARTRARITIGLLWGVIVLQLLMIWQSVHEIGQLAAVRAGGEPAAEELTPAMIAMALIALAFGIVYITHVVFWMMWVHRTYRNLPSLGAEGLTYSPGWAVGYWFIPIMNLFRPFQVMRETWRASSPEHAGGTSWKAVAVPALIGVWWTVHILENIASNASARASMRAEDVDVLYGIAWLDFVLIFVGVGVAAVEIWIVRTVTALQDTRAEAAAAAGMQYGGGAPAYGYGYGYAAAPAMPAQPYGSTTGYPPQ